MYDLNTGDCVVYEHLSRGQRVCSKMRVGSTVNGKTHRKVMVTQSWDHGLVTNLVMHYDSRGLCKTTGLKREPNGMNHEGIAWPAKLSVGQQFSYSCSYEAGGAQVSDSLVNRVISSRPVTLPDGSRATAFQVETVRTSKVNETTSTHRSMQLAVPGIGAVESKSEDGVVVRMIGLHRN